MSDMFTVATQLVKGCQTLFMDSTSLLQQSLVSTVPHTIMVHWYLLWSWREFQDLTKIWPNFLTTHHWCLTCSQWVCSLWRAVRPWSWTQPAYCNNHWWIQCLMSAESLVQNLRTFRCQSMWVGQLQLTTHTLSNQSVTRSQVTKSLSKCSCISRAFICMRNACDFFRPPILRLTWTETER